MDTPAKPKYATGKTDERGLALAEGKLRHGMKIGGEVARDFVLREALTSDLLQAEQTVGSDKELNFSAAVLAIQLVKVGTFTGPFTLSMIAEMKVTDFSVLRTAQSELSALGEAD